MAIIGATDTSRNNSIITLCYLAKNKEALQKIRDEIQKYQQLKNLKPTDYIDPSTEDVKDHFFFSKNVMNEALRFMHPVTVTDDYIL